MTNSLKNSHKLTIPDLITIGVFTALYFVLVTVATFGSAAIFPGFNKHELIGYSPEGTGEVQYRPCASPDAGMGETAVRIKISFI